MRTPHNVPEPKGRGGKKKKSCPSSFYQHVSLSEKKQRRKGGEERTTICLHTIPPVIRKKKSTGGGSSITPLLSPLSVVHRIKGGKEGEVIAPLSIPSPYCNLLRINLGGGGGERKGKGSSSNIMIHYPNVTLLCQWNLEGKEKKRRGAENMDCSVEPSWMREVWGGGGGKEKESKGSSKNTCPAISNISFPVPL